MRSDETVTCRPVFSWPGMALLDQPGDQRAVAEHALQQVALRQPGLEVVAEHVLVEELGEARLAAAKARAEVAEAPDRRSNSRWRRSRSAGAAPARAGGSAACRASGARAGPRRGRRPDRCRLPRGKVSTRSWSRFGSTERSFWMLQPVATPGRAARFQFFGSASMRADAVGEIGGERELAAGIDRDLRRVVGGARGDHLVLEHALEAEDQPGEEEGVARASASR